MRIGQDFYTILADFATGSQAYDSNGFGSVGIALSSGREGKVQTSRWHSRAEVCLSRHGRVSRFVFDFGHLYGNSIATWHGECSGRYRIASVCSRFLVSPRDDHAVGTRTSPKRTLARHDSDRQRGQYGNGKDGSLIARLAASPLSIED